MAHSDNDTQWQTISMAHSDNDTQWGSLLPTFNCIVACSNFGDITSVQDAVCTHDVILQCTQRWTEDEHASKNFNNALAGKWDKVNKGNNGQLWPEDTSVILEAGGGTPQGQQQAEPFYKTSMDRLGFPGFVPRKPDEDPMRGTIHGWWHISCPEGISWSPKHQVLWVGILWCCYEASML